jgi:hypothetical protein
MSIAVIEDAPRRWAKFLEESEKRRNGVKLARARSAVARRVKLAPGTLENLRRNRIKDLGAKATEMLRQAFLREIEREIGALTNEYELARQSGLDPHENKMREIESHIAALRELLS